MVWEKDSRGCPKNWLIKSVQLAGTPFPSLAAISFELGGSRSREVL